MRFKLKSEPCFYDKKTVTKFAWFPIKAEDNIIWLEKYECTYRYEKDWFFGCYYWKVFDKKLLNKQD
jgi:hypothetical protein